MSTVTQVQEAMSGLQAYKLAGPYHGLMVFKVEGTNGEPIVKLARILRERVRHVQPGQKTMVDCLLWIGTALPLPREDCDACRVQPRRWTRATFVQRSPIIHGQRSFGRT
jgi:hypothetical protein